MTDSDETRRPSRRGWPLRTDPTTTPAGTHDHALPRALRKQRIHTIILGCTVVALAVLLGAFVLAVLQLRADRMHENERMNQRINQSTCDLLDQLPEGGLLDRPRAKYHCGPGMPLALLTPEERAQLANRLPAPTEATRQLERAPVPTRPPGAPPRSAPPRSAPSQLPVSTPPPSAPAATAAPTTGAPDPITGPICDVLNVCLSQGES